MSLFEDLKEDKTEDKKIVKTLKPKKELSKDIFDKKGNSYIMKDDIRKQLINISNDFIDSFGIDFFIHDVLLTGSLANFNWSQYSDVDLHILLDMDEFGEENKNEIILRTIFKEFFEAKKAIWNNKRNIKIKNFDVEVYVQDINDKHVSSGVYSILNNKWVIEPEIKNPKIDDRKIIEKSELASKKINDITKITDKNEALVAIEVYKTKIKRFRQCGLEEGGEYSYENLTFKLLRRNGVIKKLLDFKKSVMDNKLSLNESPDRVLSKQLYWGGDDALAFGMMDGVMLVGVNVGMIPKPLLQDLYKNFVYTQREVAHYKAIDILLPNRNTSIHPEIPAFYTMLHELGIEPKKIDFEPHRTTNGFWRTMFKFAGRVWLKNRIISFWEYPKDKIELYKILDKLSEKIKKIYGIDIDWNEFGMEIISQKSEYGYEDEYEIIPLRKYEESESTSDEKMSAPHNLPPEEKIKHPQMIAAKDKHIEFLGKKEKGWDSLAQRNFILKKDIAEVILKESPDLSVTGNGFGDADAISFGFFNGEMLVGYNKILAQKSGFSKILEKKVSLSGKTLYRYNFDLIGKTKTTTHGNTIMFYELLRNVGIEDKDLNVVGEYKNGAMFNRAQYDYPGRIWYKEKIISFWKYPKDLNHLKSMLELVNQKMQKYYNMTIDFNKYSIEVKKGGQYSLEELNYYVNSTDVHKDQFEIPHLLPPEEKVKTKQMQDAKINMIKVAAEKEKGWGSMARRNHILNKDIAENDN